MTSTNNQITTRPPMWTRRALLTAAGSGAVAAAGLTPLRPQSVAAATTTRPLSDFLDTQGTTGILFPPVPDFVGWFSAFATPPVRLAMVDYAGLADGVLGGVLGTSFGGSITERPLKDGRAEVTVVLQTRNALTWVTDFFAGTLLFGQFAQDVAAGADAALGDSHLQAKFINTAPGAPLPDYFVAILGPLFGIGGPPEGFESISGSFRATAKGTLRAAFGVADGTPGHLTVAQTCQGATADGCPAELVELRVVGQ